VHELLGAELLVVKSPGEPLLVLARLAPLRREVEVFAKALQRSAAGRKRRKRTVSGLRPALRASISAWSKATFSRPPRTPVSMTRIGLGMMES